MGDVYAVKSGNQYSIVKVLAVDRTAIHIKMYSDLFSWVPKTVDTSTLSRGSIDGTEGFGIAHVPLSRATFAAWEPLRILTEGVTEEELGGYRLWEEYKGGVFE